MGNELHYGVEMDGGSDKGGAVGASPALLLPGEHGR